MDLEENLLNNLIEIALLEDRIEEDITTNSLIEYDRVVIAEVISKEEGIISGTIPFKKTFKFIDKSSEIRIFKPDGTLVKKGDKVIEIFAKQSVILKGERTALNFLQRLSGIATLTSKYVERLKGTGVKLLDTRKTTPGMRYLEKHAVVHGGGTNHRKNLFELAMIKENHIEMAGSITNAVNKIRSNHPEKLIEVEVKNLEELNEALNMNVYMIMLDNFDKELINEAIKITNKKVKIEVSGNINIDNIREKAIKGIDFISSGALTHSFKSLDLSLYIRG